MKPVSHLVMDQDMLDCIIKSIVSLDDAVKMEQIDVVHNYDMAPPPSTSYKTQILCEYIQVNPGQCLHESCQVLLPYHGFCSQHGGRDITTWLCTEFDDNVKLTQDHVVELPSSPSEIYKSIHEEVNGQCLRRGCINAVSYRGMCKEHGGTRRCKMRGCQKGSQGKNLCIAHGGGKRCSVDKCERSAQSHGLCKAHGGGARCTVEGTEEVVDARLQTAQLAPNEGTTAPRMAAQESVVSMDVVGRIEAEDSARFIDDIKLAVCPTANVSPSAILFIPPLVFVLPINVL
ncbi:unnamed protein product [Aphanomyces euteiches]